MDSVDGIGRIMSSGGRPGEAREEIRTLAEAIIVKLRAGRRGRAAAPVDEAVGALTAKATTPTLKAVLDEPKREISEPEWNRAVVEAAGVWSLTDPEEAGRICTALNLARPFYLVLHDERKEILALRENRREPGTDAARQPQLEQTLGLAFSGGGIRSATFNLGILQGLAECGLLRQFDYLSTVSGGGYIGSWLAAWAKRKTSFQATIDALSPQRPSADDSRRPIGFLRQFSNYITPQLGLFSADTWTMIAVYVRNVLLNMVILASAIASVLLLARLAIYDVVNPHGRDRYWVAIAIAFVLILAALYVVIRNLRDTTKHERTRQPTAALVRAPWYSGQVVIQFCASGFLLVASYMLAGVLWVFVERSDWYVGWWMALLCGLFFVAALSVAGFGGFVGCFERRRPGLRPLAILEIVFFAVLCTVTGAGLLWLLVLAAEALRGLGSEGMVHFAVFGPPGLLSILGLLAILLIGLMGIDFPDSGREWFSRFGAWLGIYACFWLALFGAAIYGPYAVAYGVEHWQTITAGLSIGWVATTIASVLSARSPATSNGESKGMSSTILGYVAVIGPPVFAAGFLVLLGLAVDLLLAKPYISGLGRDLAAYFRDASTIHWEHVRRVELMPVSWSAFLDSPFGYVVPLLVLLVFVTVVLSWRVDVNEFSLHHFYKNRLVRCYLGASNPDRRPSPFTGFDEKDDIPLSHFRASTGYDGPYPIINAALNYTGGDQLAWQERKAASFVFTPLYCGFEAWRENRKQRGRRGRTPRLGPFGYRATPGYAYPSDGIAIGTAVAISGAAVSPNMGYHTSSAVAFLMTLFDVRLGWWLGNPRDEKTAGSSSPLFGLGYLFYELLGKTDDCAGFVNLSDGGHFENLGIYELVRRRCTYIVACDAEQDNQLTFGGLASAVRKCRIDFNVEIDIDPSRITCAEETNRSRTHCVVGRINYPDATCGVLVYIKSSLTGEEPADVTEYAASHPDFPHHTTADQWFGESEFESYRKLGYHVATTTFEPALRLEANLGEGDPGNYGDAFQAAARMWYPPSEAVEQNSTKHTQTYVALMDTLRKDEKLACLDAELFTGIPPNPDGGAPARHPREEFYFCIALVQLLEDIWVDFRLASDSQSGSPYVEGWMNLYQNWIENSPTLRRTWGSVRGSYGSRFQSFWMDLESGRRRPSAFCTPERQAGRFDRPGE